MTHVAVRALLAGLSLGMRFNPLAAMVGSCVAAVVGAVTGRRGGSSVWWILVAAAAWALGDGVAVAARVSSIASGAPSLLGAGAAQWASWLLVATWAVSGFGVGYALPAGLGAAVGRRVTFGTGWLAAGAIALTVCFAIVQLADPLAAFLAHLVG